VPTVWLLGREAIELDYAIVEPALAELLRGRLVFQAKARGGTVRIRKPPSGNINLAQAFDPAEGTQETEADREASDEGPPEMDLRIVTSDMTLLLQGDSLPSLRFDDVHGIMRVHTVEQRGVRVRFDTYRGTLSAGLPNAKLKFEDVSGHVQTYGKRLLRFRGNGDVDGDAVQFEIDVHDKPERHVALHANFPKLSAKAAAAHAVSGYGKLSDAFEVHVSHGR
jgi:hypothetical protein